MAQVNFKPLERGDYTEVEERLIILRGLEVSADYAFRVLVNKGDDLPADERGSEAAHDLRLKLKSVFHRDVSINLTLELAKAEFSEAEIRQAPEDNRGRLTDGAVTGINAREAYLRYEFNPNSGLIAGKQELSIGDRRGKLFHALVPGITFDCKAGTWCFPFGWAVIGTRGGDTVIHFALQYTAWEGTADGFRDALEVEVFRIVYNEAEVPLGKNLGPAKFNPDDPDNAMGQADPSQLTRSDGSAIFYDADSQDYFGLRINWEAGQFFFNLDAVAHTGVRKYHLFDATQLSVQEVKGSAVESEIGYRWPTLRMGLRLLTATGDKDIRVNKVLTFDRGLRGYHEITPGSYLGTRLWFNGIDSDVDLGGGLGHSINNTRMVGFFLDFQDRESGKIGYSLGIYQLRLNEPIEDITGELQDVIGIEIDNMLTWFAHKALKFQFELNGIFAGGAFRADDFTLPEANPDNLTQAVFRLVYSF
ncbi:MAG: hypothetical protein IIA40_06335 [SAR324 cluster bacterium]|nr:hypothetical protein [SAR324 cluster bacterium]